MLEMRTLLSATLLMILAIALSPALQAESGLWNANIDTDWSNPGNWEDSMGMPLTTAPGDGDTATFPMGVGVDPALTAPVGTVGMGVAIVFEMGADYSILTEANDLVISALTLNDSALLDLSNTGGISNITLVGAFTAASDNAELTVSAGNTLTFEGDVATTGLNVTFRALDGFMVAAAGFAPTAATALVGDATGSFSFTPAADAVVDFTNATPATNPVFIFDTTNAAISFTPVNSANYASLTFTGGGITSLLGSFDNSLAADLTIDAGATLSLQADTDFSALNSFTNMGTLALNSTAADVSLTPPAGVDLGDLQVSGAMNNAIIVGGLDMTQTGNLTIDVDSTLVLNATSDLTNLTSVTNNGTLNIDTMAGDLTLTPPNPIVAMGALTVTGPNIAEVMAMIPTATFSSITVNGTTTLRISQDAVFDATTINNSGTLEFNSGAGLLTITPPMMGDLGSLRVVGMMGVVMAAPISVNVNSLMLGMMDTITFQGDVDLSNSLIMNDGEIIVEAMGGARTFSHDATQNLGNFTVTGDDSLTMSAGIPAVNTGTITVGMMNTLILQSDTDLTNVTYMSMGATTLDATNQGFSFTLPAGAPLGQMTVTGNAGPVLFPSGLQATNMGDQTIDMDATLALGASSDLTGLGMFVNNGTLQLDTSAGDVSLNFMAAASPGDLHITGSGGIASLVNGIDSNFTGSITIDAGAVLQFNGDTDMSALTAFNGTGDIAFAAGMAQSFMPPAFAIGGIRLTNTPAPGGFTLTTSVTCTSLTVPAAAAITVPMGETLTVSGTSTVSADLSLLGAGGAYDLMDLTFDAMSTFSIADGVSLTLNGAFTNTADVSLMIDATSIAGGPDPVTTLNITDLTVGSGMMGALTIDATAGSPAFALSGLLTVTTALIVGETNAISLSAGTLDVQTGASVDLQMNSPLDATTLTLSGTLTSDGTISADNLTLSGMLSFSGALNLGPGALSIDAAASLMGNGIGSSLTLGGADISLPTTLSIASDASVSLQGSLNVDGNVTLTATNDAMNPIAIASLNVLAIDGLDQDSANLVLDGGYIAVSGDLSVQGDNAPLVSGNFGRMSMTNSVTLAVAGNATLTAGSGDAGGGWLSVNASTLSVAGDVVIEGGTQLSDAAHLVLEEAAVISLGDGIDNDNGGSFTLQQWGQLSTSYTTTRPAILSAGASDTDTVVAPDGDRYSISFGGTLHIDGLSVTGASQRGVVLESTATIAQAAGRQMRYLDLAGGVDGGVLLTVLRDFNGNPGDQVVEAVDFRFDASINAGGSDFAPTLGDGNFVDRTGAPNASLRFSSTTASFGLNSTLSAATMEADDGDLEAAGAPEDSSFSWLTAAVMSLTPVAQGAGFDQRGLFLGGDSQVLASFDLTLTSGAFVSLDTIVLTMTGTAALSADQIISDLRIFADADANGVLSAGDAPFGGALTTPETFLRFTDGSGYTLNASRGRVRFFLIGDTIDSSAAQALAGADLTFRITPGLIMAQEASTVLGTPVTVTRYLTASVVCLYAGNGVAQSGSYAGISAGGRAVLALNLRNEQGVSTTLTGLNLRVTAAPFGASSEVLSNLIDEVRLYADGSADGTFPGNGQLVWSSSNDEQLGSGFDVDGTQALNVGENSINFSGFELALPAGQTRTVYVVVVFNGGSAYSAALANATGPVSYQFRAGVSDVVSFASVYTASVEPINSAIYTMSYAGSTQIAGGKDAGQCAIQAGSAPSKIWLILASVLGLLAIAMRDRGVRS